MKIALSQINPMTGDIKGNTDKILEELEKAAAQNANLVAFPEMAVTGYCVSDLVEDKNFLAANKEAIERIASHTNGVAAVVGFVDYDPHTKHPDGTIKKFNSAAVMQNGKIVGIANKSCLANYRYFDDKRYFSPGMNRQPIPLTHNGEQVLAGVTICEDMWDEYYEIKPVKELAEKGADFIININASPFYPKKRNIRNEIIRQHVKENEIPFFYVNTVGAADNGKNIIPFDGQSMIYDGRGNLVAIGKQFEEDMIFFDIFDRSKNPIILPKLEREKEIYEALVMGLRDYACKAGNGFKKAIVPVSGGIDSALGLAIAVDAFGPENVTAYNMPSKFNSETTKSIAQKLKQNFGVTYGVIPIQRTLDTLTEEFERHNHAIERKVTKENIHARIRGINMMTESNDSGSLLISCGNETEIALGYSTLYGDMCGGISVIGDLTKLDVYALSRYVNQKYGREMIPEDTFTIKPSAELSEGQYDPFDYYIVSPLVNDMIEKRRSPREMISLYERRELDTEKFIPDLQGKTVYDKLSKEGFEQLAYETYKQLKRSVYKRLQGPPIIAVSERAFGFDLRETMINGWHGR